MAIKRQLGRLRRKEAKVEAAAKELFGVDPHAPPPPNFHYDVAVALPHDPAHRHYGLYAETTGNWPNFTFTTWYDCRVCGTVTGDGTGR